MPGSLARPYRCQHCFQNWSPACSQHRAYCSGGFACESSSIEMTWIVRLDPSAPTNLTPWPANLAAVSWSSRRYTSVFESVFDNSTYCPPRFLTQKIVHLMALSPIDFDSLISWCEWVWE